MSIHKSKGLEFPIVFVADMEKSIISGTCRREWAFMWITASEPIWLMLHQGSEKKSFHKRAMAESMKINAIGEELRILYVALTRAVEKLILVGAVKDAGSSTAGWRARAQSHGGDYGYVYDSTNYLDLAAPAFFKSGTAKTSVVVVENIDKLYSCDTAFEAVDEEVTSAVVSDIYAEFISIVFSDDAELIENTLASSFPRVCRVKSCIVLLKMIPLFPVWGIE